MQLLGLAFEGIALTGESVSLSLLILDDMLGSDSGGGRLLPFVLQFGQKPLLEL